jgi:zinc-ribbon domain
MFIRSYAEASYYSRKQAKTQRARDFLVIARVVFHATLLSEQIRPKYVNEIRSSVMFCPNCGKDNSLELKFCASCGTNLEAVSQALTGREEDFFTRMDAGIDFFIARYSEHVFKSAPHDISERKVAKSWKLLGQACVTTLVDILLFTLMWNLLPLRFLILCISTPFRLLAERADVPSQGPSLAEGYKPPALSTARTGLWLADTAPSVTENTTTHLETAAAGKKTATTDKLA